MEDRASVASRLLQAMEYRGIKQVDLCEKTGIVKSSISTYLSGEYEPKQRNLFKIAEALEVNVSWLMGYDVPMTGNIPNSDEASAAPAPNGEVMALRERLRRQPGTRMLLDATKDATADEIRKYVDVIKAMRKTSYDDE